jgi:Protein of unknown function (DUF4238)
VAVERDFYRLRDLEEGDTEFVKTLSFGPSTHPRSRATNERWIAQFELFLGLQRAARRSPKASLELLEALDREMIDFQEKAYARMEGDAVENLAALQAGDVSFFEDEGQAARFSYFIAQQYFRTKAMRDRIRDTFSTQSEKDRFERTWPVFRYIFATNVGCDIFINRKTVKLQVVQAAPGMEFITSDQPAINTHGAFVPSRTAIEEVEYFYPVSPSRAVIISGHSVYQATHGKALDPFRTSYLNQVIERIAYEQLFARSGDALNAVVPYFCAPRTR